MKFDWFIFFNHCLDPKNKMAFLRFYDFTKDKKVRSVQGIDSIDISYSYGMHDDVDFGHLERLNMSHVNLGYITSIHFNPYAKEINLTDVRGLFGKFNFSHTEKVSLRDTDLTKVFVLQGAKRTDMTRAKGLYGYMDFGATDYLTLAETDLSRAKYRFNMFGKKIDLSGAKGLHGILEVGNTEQVILINTDLSKVPKIICGPNTVLVGAVGYTGVIERVSGKALGKKVSNDKSVYHNHARKQAYKFKRLRSFSR